MSQENVEIVRRGYDAFNRGDLGAFFQAFDPNVELHLPEGGLNVGTRRGPQAIRQLVEGFFEVWDPMHFEPERFFDVDDQRVLVFVRVSATGRGSGAQVEIRATHEFTIGDELVVRLKVYGNRSEALEAVGLSEQDAHADS
jgi:ketosteroid isomerase-like protein